MMIKALYSWLISIFVIIKDIRTQSYPKDKFDKL